MILRLVRWDDFLGGGFKHFFETFSSIWGRLPLCVILFRGLYFYFGSFAAIETSEAIVRLSSGGSFDRPQDLAFHVRCTKQTHNLVWMLE